MEVQQVQQSCDSGKPKKRKKRRFYRDPSRGDVKRTGPGPPSTFSNGSMRCSRRPPPLGTRGADCMRIDLHVHLYGGRSASLSNPGDVNEEGTAAVAGLEASASDASMSTVFGDGSGTVSSPRDGGRHKIPRDVAAIRSAAVNPQAEAFGDRSSALNSPRVFLQSSQATATGGMISLDVGSALASGASSRAVNAPLVVIGDQQRVTPLLSESNGNSIALFGMLFGMFGAVLLKLTLGSGRQ